MSVASELRKLLKQRQGQSLQIVKPKAEGLDPWDEMSWWEQGLDVLSRPNYASASFAKSIATGRGNPFDQAWKGFKGDKRVTYSDVLHSMGMDKSLTTAALGFAGDVLLDPITYLTFGAGAGVKIGIKGTQRTLTKLGAKTYEKGVTHFTSRAAKALKQAGGDAAKPATAALLAKPRVQTLLRYSRMGREAENMSLDLLATRIGQGLSENAIDRAARGGKVPDVLASVLKGARGEKALYKQGTFRLAGMPLMPAEAVSATGKAIGATYLAGEKIPAIGRLLYGARQAGMSVKEFSKKIFSTTTGSDLLDDHFRRGGDINNMNIKAAVHERLTAWAKPINDLIGTDDLSKVDIDNQIRQYIENAVKLVDQDIPDVDKIAKLQRVGDKVETRLLDLRKLADAGIEMTDFTKLKQQKGFVKDLKSQAFKATRDEAADFKKRLRPIRAELYAKGVRAVVGSNTTEYVASLPTSMRRTGKRGIAITDWITDLTKRGLLREGATDADFYDLVKSLVAGPQKTSVDDLLKRVVPPSTRRADPKVTRQLKYWQDKRQGIVDALAASPVKTIQKLVELTDADDALVALKAKMNPEALRVAELIQADLLEISRLENLKLPVPPTWRPGYFPHYLTEDVGKMLVEIYRESPRKLGRSEFSGRLAETMKRKWETTVDEATLREMIEHGALDPDKVKAIMAEKGIKLSPDDLLVFETDPVAVAIKRKMNSIRAISAADHAREILTSPFFTKAQVALGNRREILAVLEQHPGTHALYVPTKAFVERWGTPTARRGMTEISEAELKNTFITEVTDAMLDQASRDPAKKGMMAYVLDREVAEHLSRATTLQVEEESIKRMTMMWDKMTGWWRTFATVVRPGFHVRNELSNMWQMMLAGVRNPAVLSRALFIMADPKSAAGVGKYTASQVLEMADRFGIRGTGRIGRDVGDWLAREIAPTGLTPERGALKGIPGAGLLSPSGPVARLGGKVGTAFEDHAKFSLFIDGLEKGMEPVAAAMRTKKYMFDYGDLTKYERQIFRRFIPFYTWTRKNIPLQFEMALTKPGVISALGKLREAGEKNVEGTLEREHVAEFIKEGMGIPVRRSADGKTEYFLMRGWIPTADLAKLDITEIFGMLHPAVKAPIELAMNRNVFLNRPIARFPGENVKFAGMTMKAWQSHLLRNLVFVTELDRLFFKDEFAASQRMVQVGLGLRTYKQDKVIQMRAGIFNLQKQMGDLRNAIRLGTQRHGGDHEIVEKAVRHLDRVTAERDRIKADVLQIDPDALKPRRQTGPLDALLTPSNERPPPTTIQGMKRRMSLESILRRQQR